MSKYYTAKRTRGLFDPRSTEPFKLSRSKIDLFLECPRCFYLDRRLGVGRPPGFPFNLNSAVDALLKKEFDIHRAAGNPHPLMSAYDINAVPLAHEKIETWRDPFTGIFYHHEPTGFRVYGAIDDVWVNPKGELHIVDYKSTSKASEVTLDAEWQDGYKRQMEVYQWLFRRNGFPVSDTGYFVYANAGRDKSAFDGKLEFDVSVIPYAGSDAWVVKALEDARACLMSDNVPAAAPACDYCAYRAASGDVIIGAKKRQSAPGKRAPASSSKNTKRKSTLF
ncbi:MAG: PD-(D/E)XK nuclease family protein [Parcubacteria group bacterium]|nr:PD-(D/E)XK nuclease family protein [Parcubacteria group bacterium]